MMFGRLLLFANESAFPRWGNAFGPEQFAGRAAHAIEGEGIR